MTAGLTRRPVASTSKRGPALAWRSVSAADSACDSRRTGSARRAAASCSACACCTTASPSASMSREAVISDKALSRSARQRARGDHRLLGPHREYARGVGVGQRGVAAHRVFGDLDLAGLLRHFERLEPLSLGQFDRAGAVDLDLLDLLVEPDLLFVQRAIRAQARFLDRLVRVDLGRTGLRRGRHALRVPFGLTGQR